MTRMQLRRIAFLTAGCIAAQGPSGIAAQGVTTSAIAGAVRDPEGRGIDGAIIRVVNQSTGYATETRSRVGAFLAQGLPVGGPYRVIVRSLGRSPQIVDGIELSLGEERHIEFILIAPTRELDTVRVKAFADRVRSPAAGGVSMAITDSSLRRLPTLNRDLYDFVRLVPQVGTGFGVTGGGASFRYNNYVIDGVSDRGPQGNNVMGGGTNTGKSISVEAIKEYQVLLSPYDARYGEFAGVLVNSVTKSGTNELHGSVFGYLRNEQLARANSFVGNSPYKRDQFGFSLGGPILRDRLHFFIAPEFQNSEAPTPGPYVGQDASALPALPVSPGDVDRFASLLRMKGLDPGDGTRVTSLNPLFTLFARTDLFIPEWKSRFVLRENYSEFESTRFSRPATTPAVFALTGNAWTMKAAKHATSIQLFSQVSPTVFNELMAAYIDRSIMASEYQRSSAIQVGVTNGGVPATLIAGPPVNIGGNATVQAVTEIGDNLVLQLSSRHTIAAGAHVELFSLHAVGVRGRFGQWRFPTLDALENGDASSYILQKDFGSAESRVRGAQPSVYVNDEWRVSRRFSLSLGLRGDALKFFNRPRYNPAVDSVLNRRTSDFPRARAQWSPRLGFTWQSLADNTFRVRGGAGIFVGPPPLGWLLGPMRSDGLGVRTLTCTGAVGSGRVPKFIADPSQQPVVCPDGRGFLSGPIALVDRNLRMAESFRTSLAVERRLPFNVEASIESLYSKVRQDFVFVNADLKGPQAIDPHGRVLYGTIDPAGRTHPARISGGQFPEVIDVRNTSLGYSWSITGQIEKPFTNRYEMRVAYTYSRARDVQSLTNSSAIAPFDTWASSRALSGRHDDFSLGISSFEVPHRIVMVGTYAAPWTRWKTDVSLYYIGESGSPFTFGDSSAQLLGDLNADSTSANDPIYVPRDASDPSEIVFFGNDAVTQAAAFEQFILDTPCLRAQRGRIAARNSCRGPWVNTMNASLRQGFQAFEGHDVSLQLEIFNVLNFLNRSWGMFRVPNPWVLQHMGQTSSSVSQPIFRFDAAAATASTQNLESGYQLQLSLRYSF